MENFAWKRRVASVMQNVLQKERVILNQFDWEWLKFNSNDWKWSHWKWFKKFWAMERLWCAKNAIVFGSFQMFSIIFFFNFMSTSFNSLRIKLRREHIRCWILFSEWSLCAISKRKNIGENGKNVKLMFSFTKAFVNATRCQMQTTLADGVFSIVDHSILSIEHFRRKQKNVASDW